MRNDHSHSAVRQLIAVLILGIAALIGLLIPARPADVHATYSTLGPFQQFAGRREG